MDETSVNALIQQVVTEFETKPFIPHPILRNGDAQTLSTYFWPGRFRTREVSSDAVRLFEVEPGSQVLARCRWQQEPQKHPTIVIWHGMEGSITSAYMLGTAAKAARAGFNVVRVNFRNCGDTEHLSPTLYHAGLTCDLRAVIDELIALNHLPQIFVAGFSLGGNMVLKFAGEYGAAAPPQLQGVGAISPSIDLRASISLIKSRRNFIYHRSFLGRLKKRLRIKHRKFPALYDVKPLRGVRTIEDFDNQYVAPGFGFADANDYYARASARPYTGRIRIPTLIIHAEDDPFIPVTPLRDPAVAANPYLLLKVTARGGHVAFISARVKGQDRFWAENRLVEFCGLVAKAAVAISRSS